MTDQRDDMLDDIFAQARAQTPQPSDALMARVLAGAAPDVASARARSRPGLWARLSDTLGGWPAISGLAAATVAGVWIGIAPPDSVENLAASVIGDAVTVPLFSADAVFDVGDLADG